MLTPFPTKVRVTKKRLFVNRTDAAKLRALRHLNKLLRKKNRVVPYSDVTAKLDVHEVYELRARRLAKSSKPGLERFAFNLFGPHLMGSLALALDPYSKISFPVVAITPANRTRRLSSISLVPSFMKGYTRTDADFNNPDNSTPNLFDRTPIYHTTTTSAVSSTALPSQPWISGLCSDTSRRTRPIGSDYGTFELRAPYILAPPRYSDWWSRSYSRADPTGLGGIYYQVNDSHAHRINYSSGPGFVIAKSALDAITTDEVSFAASKMTAKGFGLIRLALPEHKRYDIGYNLAELKDLPMMLRHTIENVKHLSDLLSFKGLGDAFLNQQFGWDSYVQSIYAMLRLPEKISKKINYLISRRGLPTRFVSRTSGVDPFSVFISDPIYSLGTGESLVSAAYGNKRREWALRCVLNLTTKFPDIAIPKLREDLIRKAFGVVPTPTTIYNLVPWTWLLEYFVGLGEYLDLIELIHSDHSVFNYGFLTYSSIVKCPYNLETKVTDTTSWTQSPGGNSTSSVIRKTNYSCEVGLKYQKRIDISTLSGVKSFSRPSTLAVDQLAILGALLTKFVHN